MKIFFDLDGTLIDSRERLYRLFRFLVRQSRFSFDEYWDLKRNKIDHKTILTNYFFYTPEEVLNFEKEWLSKIELREWLIFDKPFAGIKEFLVEQKRFHNLYLTTSRQFADSVKFQLSAFGWDKIFDKIFITHRFDDKAEQIKRFVTPGESDWFIGDNGNDIECGKKLGIKTAAVLSGFSNRQNLVKFAPTIILNNALEFSPDLHKQQLKDEFAH